MIMVTKKLREWQSTSYAHPLPVGRWVLFHPTPFARDYLQDSLILAQVEVVHANQFTSGYRYDMKNHQVTYEGIWEELIHSIVDELELARYLGVPASSIKYAVKRIPYERPLADILKEEMKNGNSVSGKIATDK